MYNWVIGIGFNQKNPEVGKFHKKTGLDSLKKKKKNQCHEEIGTTASDKGTKDT